MTTSTIGKPQRAAEPARTAAPSAVAVKIRLHPDLLQKCRYWADRDGLSVNEFISTAVEQVIGNRNNDYDLPVLEVQRLNQIVDALNTLSTNTRNLEQVVFDGLGSLLALARGDDYLLSVDQEV